MHHISKLYMLYFALAEEFKKNHILWSNFRKCGNYEMWGLHVWGDTDVTTSWESPLVPSGRDDFGVFWDIKMPQGGTAQFIVHQGDVKVCLRYDS
jgi:hypothetical protein